MFPWGAMISLAGQAMSGISSAINNRWIQGAADAESSRRKAFYDDKANENPLSRSEVQHVLGQYDRSAQQQIENARGVAAITGATPEYALGVQKAVAEGRSDLMGSMAAGASQRADYYEAKGEQARHQKALDDQERRAARNQTYANLAANAASAAGAIMDSYGAGIKKAPAKAPAMTEEQAKSKLATMQAQSNYQKYLDTGIPDPSWTQGQIDAYKAMKGIDDMGGLGAIQRRLTPNG